MEELRNLYRGGETHFRKLLSNVTQQEAMVRLQEILRQEERKIYYIRTWEEDGCYWVDYGSWSDCFIWCGGEDFEAILKKQEVIHG